MKNMILEQLYYKVENKDCDLFKRANEFLAMEEKLRETQRKTIESELPKFSKYKYKKGFNRIVLYTGFVFDDKENIDPKVWKTKEENGEMISTPNLRTKVGKEFQRGSCYKFLKEKLHIFDRDNYLLIFNYIISLWDTAYV